MIDLHTHTTASDGLLAPAALVELAVQRGLKAIAITDHDSTEGLAPALLAAGASRPREEREASGGRPGRRNGPPGHGTASPVGRREVRIDLIPGVELSSDVDQGECHILGFYVPAGPGPFQEMLRAFRVGRVSRAEEMVKRLTQAGAPISWQRVQEIAGDGAIARPHVAQALVEAGHATSTTDAFDRWIGSGRPGYVPRIKLTPFDAVRAVVDTGAVAGIAHPILGDPTPEALAGVERQVRELVDAGLGAIEAYYTGYSAALTRTLEQLAARYGLICTGGSDFHGPGRGHGELGAVRVPDEVVDQLRQRAGAKSR
jgi:predicted metal-dependent phosphoesterase TrpH